MKKTSKPLLLLLTFVLLASACKKDREDSTPSTDPSGITGVSTIAGGAIAGFSEGTGTAAKFNDPNSIIADQAGNIYVADGYNHLIRKISPTGTVTSIAGSGTAGFSDGMGKAAQFNLPHDLAIDESENLYVTDYFNNRIRKITPSGKVTTLAGTGEQGYQDGPGTLAKFSQPSHLAIDQAGNVYVSDNNRIRKISPAGMVSTLAGSDTEGHLDGEATTAQFDSPAGIVIDEAGNLLVADNFNHCIRKITPAGMVSTFAGNGKAGYVDGSGATARFDMPSDIAQDNKGNVYVADFGSGHIRRVTPDGKVSTLAGTGKEGYADGPIATAGMYRASFVGVDAAGNVYVTNYKYHGIRKITVAL